MITFASPQNLFLGFGVFLIVIVLTLSKNQMIRMSAIAGIKIVSEGHLDRRATIIIAVSLAMGLGAAFVPELFRR
ncbi:MAG: hypothetical protein C4287_16565 [Leptolyngbya sp. ERB_1_2]